MLRQCGAMARHIGVNLALQLTVKIAWKRVKLAPLPFYFNTFHLSHPSPPQFLPFSQPSHLVHFLYLYRLGEYFIKGLQRFITLFNFNT